MLKHSELSAIRTITVQSPAIFSALEFKQMQQISVKHCLINFMTDKFDNWDGENPLVHDQPEEDN